MGCCPTLLVPSHLLPPSPADMETKKCPTVSGSKQCTVHCSVDSSTGCRPMPRVQGPSSSQKRCQDPHQTMLEKAKQVWRELLCSSHHVQAHTQSRHSSTNTTRTF